jgi:hypothetical protein
VTETDAPAVGAEAVAAPDAASPGEATGVETPAAGPEREALEARLREGGALYRLEPYVDGLECQPWVFRPHGADAARGLLVREVFTGRRPAEFAFTYAVGDAGLELVGPLELQSIPGSYADVGDDPPGARFSVPWEALGGVASGTPERWFLEEAECRATSGPTGAITGIPTCDAYLALYRECEDRLRPAIADGELRTYEAEAGWLAYTATTPERDGMAQACTGLLQSLRERCSPEP